MNPADRIGELFDRLLALGRHAIVERPAAEQIVYYVVATRCEIDIDGFASVYEQALKPNELEILVGGLRQIGEDELAAHFLDGFELLKATAFYPEMNSKKVSAQVWNQI